MTNSLGNYAVSGEWHGFSKEGNRKVAEMTYEFVKSNL